MVKIGWHPNAVRNLDGIYRYISIDSPFYAKMTVQKINSAVSNLEKLPQIGRIVPEYDDESIRELIVQKYRIMYRIQEIDIQIIAIMHSSQNIDTSTKKLFD